MAGAPPRLVRAQDTRDTRLPQAPRRAAQGTPEHMRHLLGRRPSSRVRRGIRRRPEGMGLRRTRGGTEDGEGGARSCKQILRTRELDIT